MSQAASDIRTQSEPLPAPSIVIEWENAVLSEAARANRMLEQLESQLSDLGPLLDTPEVLVLFDPDDIDHDQLRDVLETHLCKDGADQFEVELISSPNAGYYEQKNHGAERARNEVLVFLDSDAIPEDGWLEALLSPFREQETLVVAGHTYMIDSSVYEAAFKYFWFFPTREQGPGNGFFANNVAFRRETFLRYTFPEAETFRGQCRQLATSLEQNGIVIHQQPAAVCSHPPPNGARHFTVRALCAGHDAERSRETHPDSTAIGVVSAVAQYLRNLCLTGKRTFERVRFEPGMPSLWSLLAAAVLGLAYYSLAFGGQVLTALNPNLIANRFQI